MHLLAVLSTRCIDPQGAMQRREDTDNWADKGSACLHRWGALLFFSFSCRHGFLFCFQAFAVLSFPCTRCMHASVCLNSFVHGLSSLLSSEKE